METGIVRHNGDLQISLCHCRLEIGCGLAADSMMSIMFENGDI